MDGDAPQADTPQANAEQNAPAADASAADITATNLETLNDITSDATSPTLADVDQNQIVTQVRPAAQPDQADAAVQDAAEDADKQNIDADKQEINEQDEWVAPLNVERTPRTRSLPFPARVGFLGLVAVIMWWTWPRPNSPLNTVIGLLRQEPSAQETPSLAVVNPVNVALANAALPSVTPVAEAAALTPDPFPTIVVVTPTAAQPQAEQREASAANVDTANTDSVNIDPANVNGEATGAAELAPLGASVGGESAQEGMHPASETTIGDQTGDQPEPGTIVLESSRSFTGTSLGDEPLVIDLDIPSAAGADAMPAVQPLAAEENAAAAPLDLLLIPTATPTHTPQPVSIAQANIPHVNIVPAIGVEFTPTPEPPTPTPTVTPTPSPTPISVGPGRLWSTFVPRDAAENDHFWLDNPFQDFAANRYASPNYQFGSTAGNRYRPHHGVDVSNPLNTPVRAGAAGEVVHAGLDDPDLLGPYANFYGKAVVIRLDQRLPVAGGEMDVFVLYGHLNEVRVEVGQRVQSEDIVGLVGMTGIAIGPHLHIEVRLGANTYAHTVNPYLWLKPAPGNGAVAVRALTADGRTWAGAKVSIARFEGGKAVWARQIETYLDTEQIGPDPAWGENGAMGDVPAGTYYLIANIAGENIRAEFEVRSGETTFVEIRTQQ